MPLYNFKQQFADAVRSGRKRQTIRARGKRQAPQPGQVAHLYTGLRTRDVCPLGTHPIVSVTQISISVRSRIVQTPNQYGNTWIELDSQEVEQLARDDGFDSADTFFAFFGADGSTSFSGYLIKW